MLNRFFLCLFVLGILAAMPYDASAKLICHWKFDEDPNTVVVENSVGPENRGYIEVVPGTSQRSAVFTGPGGGYDGIGGALNTEVPYNYYGTDYYFGQVRIIDPNLAALDKQITLTWWQKGSDLLPYINGLQGAESSSTIVGAYANPPVNKWIIWAQCPSTRYSLRQFVWYCGADLTSQLLETEPNNFSVPGDGQINWYKNQWIHYACTKNADTGSMKVFRNGELWYEYGPPDYSFVQPIDGSKTTYLSIGAHPYNQDYYIGLLDDVRIYDTELSPSEIRALLCTADFAADLNKDCIVNLNDYAVLASQWLNSGVDPNEGDLNEDGTVNIQDLDEFVTEWLFEGFWTP